MKSKTPAWMRRRGYRHFDDVKRGTDPTTQQFDSNEVAKHAFLPLIGKTQVTRRYKPAEKTVRPKERPLRYAAHKDARIYARYAWILSQAYEQRLAMEGFGDCVIAYRSLPSKQSNIESARQSFGFIGHFGECDVLTADVSGFFDALDHQQLKAQWCGVLGTDHLPHDHFAIFKQLTRYRYVELAAFLKSTGTSKASLSRHSRPGKRGDRFADMAELRQIFKKDGLVKKHTNPFGIPQGSPISAVLSNIYMLEVDAKLSAYAQAVGGFYRRYSDDLLLVVPPGHSIAAKHEIETALAFAKLESNEEKAELHLFRRNDDGKLATKNALEYLGFQFDGQRVLLKQKTLTRFYQRSARLIKQMRSAARAKGATSLNRKRIFDRCTHLGSRNFVAYTKRASRVFYPDQPGPSPIMRQMRRHTKIIQARIDAANDSLSEHA